MSKQAVIDATGSLLRAQGVRMVYGDGQGEVVALQGVDLTLSLGETMAVVGASGAGKSTLLHILGGLDFPTSGEVWFEGRTLVRMSDKERTSLRNERIGFVYQFHHLLPEFTAQENVAMPLVIRRMSWVSALEAAAQMLDKAGLSQRLSHTPAMLSGGERQRVAIARALVTQPHCLLADEPTGNLDRDTAARVFDVLIERVRESKCGLIVVTHDPLLAARCDRQLQL